MISETSLISGKCAQTVLTTYTLFHFLVECTHCSGVVSDAEYAQIDAHNMSIWELGEV